MGHLVMKARGTMDQYPQFEGETPFAKAVNEKIATYWTLTGQVMPAETACFEVLADAYDVAHAKVDEEPKEKKKKTI